MKLTKKQATDIYNVLKNFEEKESNISLEVKDGYVRFNARNRNGEIILKHIKAEEKDTELVSIMPNFLKKISSQNAEDFTLKINKKSISSKVNDVGFKTAILDEETNIEITEETKEEKIKIMLSKEVFEEMKKAINFIDKAGKKPILQSIHLKLKDGIFHIQATNSFKIYQSTFEDGTEGEFDITILEDTVTTLLTIYELTGERGFPIHVTDSNIFIIVKGMYFKGTLLEGNYPDFEKALQRAIEDETIMILPIDEELIKKLKAIKTDSKELIIVKKENKITFTTKTETEENSFSLDVKEGIEDFEKKIYYDTFAMIIEGKKKVSIKKSPIFLIEEKNHKTLALGFRE